MFITDDIVNIYLYFSVFGYFAYVVRVHFFTIKIIFSQHRYRKDEFKTKLGYLVNLIAMLSFLCEFYDVSLPSLNLSSLFRKCIAVILRISRRELFVTFVSVLLSTFS